MVFRFSFLVLLWLCSGVTWTQKSKLTQGFNALSARNFGSAQEVFYRHIDRNKSVASYGLFKLFSESKDFYSLDSAWNYLNLSIESYRDDSLNLKKKELARYQLLGWNYQHLLNCYEEFSMRKFSSLTQVKNIRDISDFIAFNPRFKELANAVRFRDSLWLDSCDGRDLFCLYGLKAISPFSEFHAELADLMDRKAFEEWVVDNTELELATYLQYHPKSRFFIPAQDELYRIYLQESDTNRLKYFLNTYPDNRNCAKIWKAYFHASIGNYDPQKMSAFLAIHPNYPFKNTVLQELKWYGKYLFPVINHREEFGFMDEEGNLIVDFAYEEVNEFSEGLAAVSKNGKYGVITTSGEVAVDFVYELISDYQLGHAIVKDNGKYGLIDRNGKTMIPIIYEDLQFVFSDQLLFFENGRYGLMNMNGRVVKPAQFIDFLPFNESCAIVTYDQGKAILHSSLELLIPRLLDEIEPIKEGFIASKDEKYGVFDFFGREVVPLIYDEVIATRFPYLIVRKENKFFHISTADWLPITEPTETFDGWEHIAVFNGTNFLVLRKGNYYWVDSTGKSSKFAKVPWVKCVHQTVIGSLEPNGMLGIFNRQGNALTNLEFQEVQVLENGFIKVVKDGKSGVFSEVGTMLLNASYSDITYWPSVDLFRTEKDGKQGVYDSQGKMLLSEEYSTIKVHSKQILSVNIGGQLLYYNFILGKLLKLKG